MEHRALALEYRPQEFDQVAGQLHVTQVLARALAHGRVHHAYLFSGPRGVGKTTTARILAKILNCPNEKDGKPCNVCEVCRDITAGVSLDVQEIDGASNRGIADVQQLREKVRFTPTGGRYKVVIIDEVHQLSSDAFAALLKTLEEPPPHVVFVFATTDPLKLPDTIRSRCQRYDFGRLPLPAIVERLKGIAAGESKKGRKITLADEAAFLLARKAEGSMRDAVSALDQVLSTGVTKVDEEAVNEVLGLVSREVFFRLGEKVLGREPEKALAVLHNAYRDGVDPKDLAEGLLDHLRNLLVLRIDPKAEDLVAANEEEKERYLSQGAEHDTGDLLRLMRIVNESLWAMRESPQPLTHLEIAVVECASLEPGVRLAEVLERLEALEDGGPGGAREPSGSGGGTRARAGGKASAPSRRRSPGSQSQEPVNALGDARIAGGAPVQPAGARSPAPPAPDPGVLRAAAEPEAAVAVADAEATEVEEAAVVVAGPDAERWRQVIHRIKERKLMVGVFLEESRWLGWEEDTLTLGADEVHRSLLEAPDNRSLIVETISEVFERKAGLRFRELPPEVRAQARARAQAESAKPGAPRRGNGRPPAAAAAAPVGPSASSPGEPPSGPAPAEVPPGPANGTGEGASTEPDVPPVSPVVKRAMIWCDGEVVRQTEPGGTAP